MAAASASSRDRVSRARLLATEWERIAREEGREKGMADLLSRSACEDARMMFRVDARERRWFW